MVGDIINTNTTIGTQNIIETHSSSIKNNDEFVAQLNALKEEIHKAIQSKELDQDDAEGAQNQVNNAIEQVKSKQPDIPKLTRQIKSAQLLTEGVTGLAKSFGVALEAVARLFS